MSPRPGGDARPGEGRGARLARGAARLRALPAPARYALAAAVLVLAALLRVSLDAHLSAFPFVFFTPAVVLCALFLGGGTGTFATLAASLLTAYIMLEPRWSFAVADPGSGLGLAVFLALGLSLSALLDRLVGGLAAALGQGRRLALAAAEQRHRSRNNLQAVAGVLAAQAATAGAGEAREALRAAAERVACIARAELLLGPGGGPGGVDAGELLASLAAELRLGLLAGRPVSLEVAADPARLPAGDATAVALLLNEMVTNAAKHAFPGGRAGRVTASLRRDGAGWEPSVADDGVGAAPGAPDGLGTQVINALAAQLGGTAARSSGLGVAWSVRFPGPRA